MKTQRHHYQIVGRDAYRAMWGACLPHFPARFVAERRDFDVTVSGDLAFAHCPHHIRPVDAAHPAGQMWLRATICYRRIDCE